MSLYVTCGFMLRLKRTAVNNNLYCLTAQTFTNQYTQGIEIPQVARQINARLICGCVRRFLSRGFRIHRGGHIIHRRFAGAGDFLRRYAAAYRADLWEDFSDTYVEVWAESRSLASVLESDCKELAVSLYLSGGFSSHSFIYASAQYIKRVGRHSAVVYVGDYDPAGVLIDQKIEQGLRMHLGAEFSLTFDRLAINQPQIEQYDLPTKPRKTTDRRRLEIKETVEAEAMPAHIMRAMVREKVESYLEPGALEVAKAAEQSERAMMGQYADLLDYQREDIEELISQN